MPNLHLLERLRALGIRRDDPQAPLPYLGVALAVAAWLLGLAWMLGGRQ
jgi:hypothetical protein